MIKTMLCAVVAVLLGASGCGVLAADITVSAAVSLSNAFGEIGKAFEKASQGRHKVLFNFGASGSLLQQISRGAPVDVFASADLDTMDRAEKQNLIYRDSRSNFVSNRLVLAVPAQSTATLGGLQELMAPAVQRVAMGIPESVPVGRYTKGVLEAAGLWDVLRPKMIYGQNVRQCLDYVARGEVDAGFVYATDALLMKDRMRVALTLPTPTPIQYPIAVVKGNGQEKSAREFVTFVLRDPVARKVFDKYGFLVP